jgi:site-specific recombinase XerC
MTETQHDSHPDAVVWHLLIDRWHTTLRAKALSKETIRGYLYTAHHWARWLTENGYDLEPRDIRDTHIEEFIADIVVRTSAANAAYNYRNMRVFWAWLVKREKITTCPGHRVRAGRRRSCGTVRHMGRHRVRRAVTRTVGRDHPGREEAT